MTPVRIILPDDCSMHHPAVRAWRAAIDKANAELASKMGWKLNVNFTEMTFVPAVPEHSNVVFPTFRKTMGFLHPRGDGPQAA